MDRYVRRFIRSSLIWFGIGVLLGLGVALWPYRLMVIRPAHVHANLLGFVSMMIFGVAYHVIPRFSGSPLHRPRLADLHLVVANVGLALLIGGWIARATVAGLGAPLLHAGAVTSAVGAGLFIYNLWRTLDASPGIAGAMQLRSVARSTGAKT